MTVRRGRKLKTIGLLLLVLAVGIGAALTRSKEELADNDFDVLRLPNSIADGAHLADEKGFFAANRIRIAILEQFDQIKPGSIKPADVFTNEYNPHAAEPRANR